MLKSRALALAACTRIAGSQHGVVSASQAVGAGLSAPGIQRLVRAGAWTRVHPCVYALWTPGQQEARLHQRLSAASLWVGSKGAVSHRAAATIFELDGVNVAPVEVVTIGRHRATEPGMIVHRARTLEPDEVVVRNGIRMTSVVRTLLDLCAVVDGRTIELAVESALRGRMATVDQLRATLMRRGRVPGRRVLDALLERHPGIATDSALEVIVWNLLVAGGLPPPMRQYEVRSERGALVARVDLAYPAALLAIEADGYEFHSSRRDLQRDRARQNALVRLGWTVYRVTWEDATRHAERVRSDVATLLSRAGVL